MPRQVAGLNKALMFYPTMQNVGGGVLRSVRRQTLPPSGCRRQPSAYSAGDTHSPPPNLRLNLVCDATKGKHAYLAPSP